MYYSNKKIVSCFYFITSNRIRELHRQNDLSFLHFLVWEDKKRTGHFRRMLDEQKWCEKNFLQSKSLWEVSKTIEEIKRSLDRFQIKSFYLPNNLDRQNFRSSDNNYLMLKICVFGAFYPNYFMRCHGQMDMTQCNKLINLRDVKNKCFHKIIQLFNFNFH